MTVRFADDAPRVVAKDQAYVANLVVTNHGTANATNAMLRSSVWGSANEFSPTWGSNPGFNPALTYASGCDSVAGAYCMLGTIAAGQTKVVQVSVTGITHYGRLQFSNWGWHDEGSIEGSSGYNSWSVQVTNGSSVVVGIDATTPQSAAGSTDIVIPGEVSVGSSGPLAQGLLFVRTTRLGSTGDYFQSWNASKEPEVGSIKGLTLSNGTVCTAHADPVSGKASLNEFVCSLNGFPAGSRVTFELIVNFPTSRRDLSVNVWANVITTSFLAPGSQPAFTKTITLNPERTVDLVTEASSQALIGQDRDATVTVRVSNKGTTTAEGVTIAGDARGGIGGRFQRTTIDSRCTGITKPIYTRCSIGSIAPGATATFRIDVHAANRLGMFAATFGATHANGGAIETNPDDNATTLAFSVVKPNMVPFLGVKQTRPPGTTTALLARRGTRATFVCPSSCRVVTQLRVRRVLAERLGLVRPIRNARAAKRALPYIVIGSAAKARAGRGRVVMIVRLTRTYRTKVQALRRPLTISRVATVTSTYRGTRGATFTGTRSMSVRPARR